MVSKSNILSFRKRVDRLKVRILTAWCTFDFLLDVTLTEESRKNLTLALKRKYPFCNSFHLRFDLDGTCHFGNRIIEYDGKTGEILKIYEYEDPLEKLIDEQRTSFTEWVKV